MKTVWEYMKKFWPLVPVLFVWIILTIFNVKIYWMLIDDGWDIVFSSKLAEKLFSLDLISFVSQLIENGGRFRPFYWIFRMFEWLIGANNYQIHHLIHMIVFAITSVFVFLILKKLTKSNLFSMFGSLVFLTFPLNTENIIRIGPQEPLLVMILSAFFYYLIKNKNVTLSVLLLILALLTKETAIALLPVILFYFIYTKFEKLNNDRKKAYQLWIAICLSAIFLIPLSFLRKSGYGSNYVFDIAVIGNNLKIFLGEININTYYIFSILPGVYLSRIIWRFYKKHILYKDNIDIWEFLFFLSAVCFFVIQLPWRYTLTRYLMPTTMFLTIFFFIELSIIFNWLKTNHFIKKYINLVAIGTIVFGIYIVSIWLIGIQFKQLSQISNYNLLYKLSKLPPDSVVLINVQENENTTEIIDELSIHLTQFWNRNDIQIKYFSRGKELKGELIIVDTDSLPRVLTYEELKKNYGEPVDKIEQTQRNLILTTPFEMIKQSIKKIVRFAIYRERPTLDGMVARSFTFDNWYFFRFKY